MIIDRGWLPPIDSESEYAKQLREWHDRQEVVFCSEEFENFTRYIFPSNGDYWNLVPMFVLREMYGKDIFFMRDQLRATLNLDAEIYAPISLVGPDKFIFMNMPVIPTLGDKVVVAAIWKRTD